MNQSGIEVSPELAKAFAKFVESDERAAILQIANEACELDRLVDAPSKSESVHDALAVIQEHLGEGKDARYVVFRVPEADEFAFIQFMPDAAPLSSKMKYASSTVTVQRQLGGSSVFPKQIFWTELDEVSGKGWDEHIAHEEAEAPLTEEEESLRRTVEAEQSRGTRPVATGGSSGSRGGSNTLGISAELSPEVNEALSSFSEGQGLVFSVNKDEIIGLDNKFEVGPNNHSHFTGPGPQYGLLNVPDHGVAFIQVTPSSSKIKDRMIAASSRAAFVEHLRKQLDVPIAVEIESLEPEVDLSRLSLQSELGPKAEPEPVVDKPRFRRPKPPGRR